MQGSPIDADAVAASLYRVLVDSDYRDAIAINGQSRAVREDLIYHSAEKWLAMLAMAMAPSTRAARADVIARAAAAQAAGEGTSGAP